MIKTILRAFKVYHCFWVSMILLTCLSFLKSSKALDIQLHDTYYVISLSTIGIITAILSGFFGLTYWLLRNKNYLLIPAVLHCFVTLLCFLFLILSVYFQKIPTSTGDQLNYIRFLTYFSISFIFAQILFAGNILYTLIKSIL